MQTIIKTWACICGYHQDFQSKILLCPSCKKDNLFLETDLTKKAAVNILNIKDIDVEISNIEESKVKSIDISTEKKKDEFKEKRQKEIQETIEKINLLEDK